MKSKQEKSYGLIEKARRGLNLTAAKARRGIDLALFKVRSGKLPLSRLATYLSSKKTTINQISSKLNRAASYYRRVLKPNISGCLTRLSAVNRVITRLSHFLQHSLPGNPREYLHMKSIAATAAAVALTGVLIGANLKVDAFAVEADGKTIAIIEEKGAAEQLLADLKSEKSRLWNRKVDVKQKLAFEKVTVKRYQVDNLLELKNKLNKNVTFVAVATGISVDGQVAVTVKDSNTANKVLKQLKNSFAPEDVKIENITFEEKVELVDVPISLKEVSSVDEALQILKEGKQKKVIHVVEEGDSLWSIARKNDMHVADLLKANPSIKGEHLDLGQEINLVALEPVINVVVTGQQTVEETVPYKVVVQKDNSLWRGREKVKSSGENGSRQVTYQMVMKNGVVVEKDVLNEKVLKVAKNKIVVRGSRYVVASRSGGGKLGWPVNGRINSGYGKRWGRMHTGLDIDANEGQPVGAAAAGVVTGAGWDGGYGKTVTIRHSNGLVTRYAHLSKIEVQVGQSVERGDLIGLAGSTGRSTGTHVHFEVLSGGSFQNPIEFLK